MTVKKLWDKWIAPREATMTVDVPDDVKEWVGAVDLTRSVRITLPEGKEFPLQVKRGTKVELTFASTVGTVTLRGRTRFRRKNVAVFDGTVTAR